MEQILLFLILVAVVGLYFFTSNKNSSEKFWYNDHCKGSEPQCMECGTSKTKPCTGLHYNSYNDCYSGGECNLYGNVGGPYEDCQDQICHYDKQCIQTHNKEITKCCVQQCADLPSAAKAACESSCTSSMPPKRK